MILKVVHNTDPESAESIFQNGFDLSRFGYATKKSGQHSTFGVHPKGIYFTTDMGQQAPSAHPWDHRKIGRLIRCVVELKNPLVIEPYVDGKFYQIWLYEKYRKKGAALTNALKKEGYDGIVAGEEVIAFRTDGITLNPQGFKEWLSAARLIHDLSKVQHFAQPQKNNT